MKSNYRVRARRLFESMYSYIERARTPEDFVDGVWNYNLENNRQVRIRWGKTRIVFLCSDYVIKIDYGMNGCYLGTCLDEVYRYAEAENDGYEHLLVPITQEVYKGWYYYIMPRVRGMQPKYDDSWEKYVDDDEADWIYNHIHDLHNENYAIVNNHIEIFDYACGE